MILATAVSKNGVKIRLTEERWKHIVLMHPNLSESRRSVLATVKDPDYLFKGRAGESVAVLKISQRSYLVVVYKETSALRTREREADGFIITAYETTAKLWLFKKELIWNKHS